MEETLHCNWLKCRQPLLPQGKAVVTTCARAISPMDEDQDQHRPRHHHHRYDEADAWQPQSFATAAASESVPRIAAAETLTMPSSISLDSAPRHFLPELRQQSLQLRSPLSGVSREIGEARRRRRHGSQPYTRLSDGELSALRSAATAAAAVAADVTVDSNDGGGGDGHGVMTSSEAPTNLRMSTATATATKTASGEASMDPGLGLRRLHRPSSPSPSISAPSSQSVLAGLAPAIIMRESTSTSSSAAVVAGEREGVTNPRPLPSATIAAYRRPTEADIVSWHPEREICARAISFYQYQTSQEAAFQAMVLKNAQDRIQTLERRMQSIIHEANNEISLLRNKWAAMERDYNAEQAKAKDLSGRLHQSQIEYSRLQAKYDKLHRATLQPESASQSARLSRAAAHQVAGGHHHRTSSEGSRAEMGGGGGALFSQPSTPALQRFSSHQSASLYWEAHQGKPMTNGLGRFTTTVHETPSGGAIGTSSRQSDESSDGLMDVTMTNSPSGGRTRGDMQPGASPGPNTPNQSRFRPNNPAVVSGAAPVIFGQTSTPGMRGPAHQEQQHQQRERVPGGGIPQKLPREVAMQIDTSTMPRSTSDVPTTIRSASVQQQVFGQPVERRSETAPTTPRRSPVTLGHADDQQTQRGLKTPPTTEGRFPTTPVVQQRADVETSIARPQGLSCGTRGEESGGSVGVEGVRAVALGPSATAAAVVTPRSSPKPAPAPMGAAPTTSSTNQHQQTPRHSTQSTGQSPSLRCETGSASSGGSGSVMDTEQGDAQGQEERRDS